MLAIVIFSFMLVNGSCNVEVLGNAKNVILVIANGMSSSSVTLARVQEALLRRNSSYLLSFESFPHHGVLKTYNNKFEYGSQGSARKPLFFGSYDQQDGNKTLFTSALKNKKSVGLVTTLELENLLSIFNQVGLEDCFGSNRHNCSDDFCSILYGCLGVDIIVGKRPGPLQFNDSSCDCFHNYGYNNTNQLKMIPRREYINRTEEFRKLGSKEGVTFLGLFSENDFMKNQTVDNLTVPNLTKVVDESIKILSGNPYGYFMVVLVGYNDVARTVKVVSALSNSIRRVTPLKDTLLVVTSDMTSTQKCDHKNIKNEVFVQDHRMSGGNEVLVNNSVKHSQKVTSSPMQGLVTQSSNVSHNVIESKCTKVFGNNYIDVPLYAYGPYSFKIPAVQDETSFGLKLMKILETEHYEDIKFDSEFGELDSDMFHKDIKAAMEEIDEMTKELFSEWL